MHGVSGVAYDMSAAVCCQLTWPLAAWRRERSFPLGQSTMCVCVPMPHLQAILCESQAAPISQGFVRPGGPAAALGPAHRADGRHV